MTRRGRSGGRAVARAKGSFIWTAVDMGNNDVLTTPFGFNIVEDADWVAHAGQQSGTLMSIRGWLSASRQAGTAADILEMYIAVIDEDESATGASVDPASVATYTGEDILWTGGASFPGAASDSGFRSQPVVWDINVKARRKIRSGKEVRLQVTTTVGEIALSGFLRALIKV